MSPFPGMDPYLESQPFWADFHAAMLIVMKAELKKRLPRKYAVWSDIYIWLHEPDAQTRRGRPDELITAERSRDQNGGVATMPAPATTLLPAVRREGSRYLKIKEARTERVVTVIEFLSPANKASGPDRDGYLAKRNEYLATQTNLVEIDLHRTGRRMPMGKPKPPRADYYVQVCRAVDFPKTGVWPISVRDSLPDIPVPLNPADDAVFLPLQACFSAAYDMGPYDVAVDYGKPPRITLHGDDAAWAKAIAKKAAHRA